MGLDKVIQEENMEKREEWYLAETQSKHLKVCERESQQNIPKEKQPAVRRKTQRKEVSHSP